MALSPEERERYRAEGARIGRASRIAQGLPAQITPHDSPDEWARVEPLLRAGAAAHAAEQARRADDPAGRLRQEPPAPGFPPPAVAAAPLGAGEPTPTSAVRPPKAVDASPAPSVPAALPAGVAP